MSHLKLIFIYGVRWRLKFFFRTWILITPIHLMKRFSHTFLHLFKNSAYHEYVDAFLDAVLFF